MTDCDGNECPLETLVRREPEWAANRIRHMLEEILRLKLEIDELREALTEVAQKVKP